VVGSRQFKDFDEYLLTPDTFAQLRSSGLSIAVTDEASSYLEKRSRQLHESLAAADRLGAQGQLPDVLIVEGRLKIKALENSLAEEAVDLMRQAYALLPRVKITDLLIEVGLLVRFHSATDPQGNAVELSGQASDVLRRQADGTWLLVIDNPYGVEAGGHASRA
jgi:hypothetical protein